MGSNLGILKKLPMHAIVILFINVVFYSMASTVVFSFLPKMVKWFGASELSTGYYAGVIASSLFLGRFLFSMVWGYLADTIGKKFAAVLTGFILLLTTLSFGFSTNFYWATTTRFLQGCSMGQIIVSKAILADICDDDTMPIGISIVMTAFSVGYVIGPSVGGFLVFPSEQFPETFSEVNVFSTFPALLPILVIVFGLGMGVVLTIIFIPNDRKSEDRERLIDEEKKENPSYRSTETCQATQSEFKPIERIGIPKRFRNSKMARTLRIRECMYSSLLYGMFSITDSAFIEIFPVFAATSQAYRGLGFTTEDIGVALMVISIVLVVLQITLLPKFNEKYGSKRVLIGSNLVLTLILPLLPAVSMIANKNLLWGILLFHVFLVRSCAFLALVSINIFVNNSVGPSLLGTANGIGLMFASIGRLLGPLVVGPLYSWSLTNIKGVTGNSHPLGFPFNQYLVFLFLSLWSVVIAVMTRCVGEGMDQKTRK